MADNQEGCNTKMPPPAVPIVMTPPDEDQTSSDKLKHESLDLNNVEVIDDLNINRWLMRIMRLGASYVSTGSNGYRTGSISSSASSGSKSRRLSIADTSASNLLRPPNTSRGRRFSDSMNFDTADLTFLKPPKQTARSRKGRCIFQKTFRTLIRACGQKKRINLAIFTAVDMVVVCNLVVMYLC